jgi:hypothetical protein
MAAEALVRLRYVSVAMNEQCWEMHKTACDDPLDVDGDYGIEGKPWTK